MALHLFTPRLKTGQRLAMQLNDEDIAKIGGRGVRYKVTVTDQETGFRYIVKDAACSALGCHCDSLVVQELR